VSGTGDPDTGAAERVEQLLRARRVVVAGRVEDLAHSVLHVAGWHELTRELTAARRERDTLAEQLDRKTTELNVTLIDRDALVLALTHLRNAATRNNGDLHQALHDATELLCDLTPKQEQAA